MYKAVDIANIFAQKGISEGIPVTQMKLQKLIYFAQGMLLARTDGKDQLVKESFQAWDFGPVIPAIYHEFKQFGKDPITPENDFLRMMGLGHNFNTIIIENPDHRQLIEETWETLKELNGITLSNWTHRQGSAWSKIYKPLQRDLIIPNEEIMKEFKDFLEKAAS